MHGSITPVCDAMIGRRIPEGSAWPDGMNCCVPKRKRQGAGQARVAAAAGVSIRTVERYEAGGFKPVRATLIRLGRALQLPASRLNAILTAAGSEPRPPLPGRPGTLQTLQATMATFPWPSLMLNERVEIVAWNRPAVPGSGTGLRQCPAVAAPAQPHPLSRCSITSCSVSSTGATSWL